VEVQQRSNPFINLPTSIFLTAEGLRLVGANAGAIQREKNRDGKIKEGLVSDRYNAHLVQKLVLNSFAEEIYVKSPGLLRYRPEIISTNNMIVYAILYKKLSPSLAAMLFESPVVKAYNRKNPKNSINNLSSISREKVDQMRRDKAELFEGFEQEIHAEVTRRVQQHRLISDEDKQTRIRSLDKFIAWIDRRIWYLYLIIYQTPLKAEMLSSFASNIATYLDRTQIATHTSNLLMEFIQNAERAHLERLVVRGRFATKDSVDAFIRDGDNRIRIMREAERLGQMLELTWSMNPESASVGQQYRISITVSNYGLISEELQMTLSQKMRANVEGISLARFYEDAGDERLGAGLGLMYNSYLEDVCRKEGLVYRCNIYPEPSREKTTVKMELVF
jgi:hypothetical protein